MNESSDSVFMTKNGRQVFICIRQKEESSEVEPFMEKLEKKKLKGTNLSLASKKYICAKKLKTKTKQF